MTLTGGPGITTGNAITTGNVRVFANSWWGKTTIQVTHPGKFRVLTNLPAQNNVGAYPDVFNGKHYDWQTAGPLPQPISVVWNTPLWYTGYSTAPRNPSSRFMSDFDCWYFNKGTSISGHGQTELVVANRYQGAPSGQLVFIRGGWYRWQTWTTTDTTGLRWRLVLFYEVRKTAQLRISLQAFTRFLYNHGLVHAGSWLGSVHYGFENWFGGAGETVSFHVGR
ncbi:MAG: hypothetical protein J2P28_08535 [Actinobacteria bacterium]|nr:hypothetical protein [Actinomycetota bacterium]